MDRNRYNTIKEFMDGFESAYVAVACLPKEVKYQLIGMLLNGTAKDTLSFALENYEADLAESIKVTTEAGYPTIAETYKAREEERKMMLDLIVGGDY